MIDMDTEHLTLAHGGAISVSRLPPTTIAGPVSLTIFGDADIGVSVTMTENEARAMTRMVDERLTGRRTSYTLEVPVHEWLNSNDRRHYMEQSRQVKVYRESATWLAMHQKLGALEYVVVDAFPVGPHAMRVDPGNLYPTVKAVLDGLVDAGVLPDDRAKHVDRVTMHKPQPGDNDALRLRLTSVT